MQTAQPENKTDRIKSGVVINLGANGLTRKVKGERKPRKRPILQATPSIEEEHARRVEEAKNFEESKKASKAKKAAESDRIEGVKTRKRNRQKLDAAITVMEDGGRRRTVKRLMTTCDKMLQLKTIPPHLRSAVGGFAILVADGMAVATKDGDDSTNRLTVSYDPVGGTPGFQSKTLSDRQLEGLTAMRRMKARIPDDLMPTFLQIVSEETGAISGRGDTLTIIGERHGFKYRQASSAGSMQVVCIAAMISHFLKERGGE